MRHCVVGRRSIAILSTVLMLTGCVHVHPADPTAAGVDLDGINRKLAGRMARVILVDGTELVANDVRVSAESVSFRVQRFPGLESPWPSREVQELPIGEVHSVEVTDRGRGAADGALIGTGVGFLAGAAIGAAINEADEAPIWSNETGALVGGVVLGALGTGVGSLVGLGQGSRDVFDLTKAPSDAEGSGTGQ